MAYLALWGHIGCEGLDGPPVEDRPTRGFPLPARSRTIARELERPDRVELHYAPAAAVPGIRVLVWGDWRALPGSWPNRDLGPCRKHDFYPRA